MASVEVAELTSVVSGDAPCGSNFDAMGDLEFMNFMARAEGLLPTSFFSGPEGKPLDQSLIDFDAEFARAKPFLAQTRDIRLLLLLAKFSIIDRDLDSFVKLVSAVATLLDTQWGNVYPRDEDDGFGIRLAVLDTLDDMAPVIFPLQYAPLVEHRNLGAISYRSFMFATGKATPREGEESRDLATLEKALAETELSRLVERRTQLQNLQTTLAAIRKACDERLGAGVGPSFEKLSDLTAKIVAQLNAVVVKIDPSAGVVVAGAGEANEPASPPPAAGRIKSNQDAADALTAVARYFSRFEPSNPALPLIRQAEQLIGKSMLEIMKILIPAQFEQAKFVIGKEQSFEIPIERLTQLEAVEYESDPPDPASDAEEAIVEARDEGEGSPEVENSPVAETVSDAHPEAQSPVSLQQARAMRAESRKEALVLLDQVATYYSAAEPSSPIALIAERARLLAERDFLTILKELLPPS